MGDAQGEHTAASGAGSPRDPVQDSSLLCCHTPEGSAQCQECSPHIYTANPAPGRALCHPACSTSLVGPRASRSLPRLFLLPAFNNIINVWFGFLLNIGLEAGVVSLPPRQIRTACLEVPILTFICLSCKLFDCPPLFHLCLAWQLVLVLP